MTNRTKLLIIIPAVVLVLAVAGGLWWYLQDDAPDEVSLESAIESVDTTSGSSDTTATTDGSSAGAISGTWVVDAESGEFDFESATGTFAGFRIQEELVSVGAATAVGRTGDVSGSITIDGTTLTEAEFEVDLTTITTNESRRDDRVQDALETSTFPTATFTLTEPVELGAGAADGEPVTVTATGDLTIHGVTQPVELPIEAQLVEGTVVVVGSLDLVFADYGVAVPTAPVVVSAEDNGVLEVQILLVKE
jgi:polyisoprenoid-binding protein YceI